MKFSWFTTVSSGSTFVRKQRTVSGQYTTSTARTSTPATVPTAVNARHTGNSAGRRIQHTAYSSTSGGISRIAENFTIIARAIAADAASNRALPPLSRYSTHNTHAKKKNAVSG